MQRMARKGSGIGWLSVLCCSSLLACSSTSSLLVARFSREQSCQPDQVRVSERGGNEYLAEGCGQRARYVCSSFTGDKNCAEQGLAPQAEPTAPARRVPIGVPEPPK